MYYNSRTSRTVFNMLMLVSMTLTLMQGHSGSAKAKSQRWIISTSKQAISIKLATTVSQLLRDLDFFKRVYGLILMFYFTFFLVTLPSTASCCSPFSLCICVRLRFSLALSSGGVYLCQSQQLHSSQLHSVWLIASPNTNTRACKMNDQIFSPLSLSLSLSLDTMDFSFGQGACSELLLKGFDQHNHNAACRCTSCFGCRRCYRLKINHNHEHDYISRWRW